jgi:signal transduction histidine kinase/DNA-binding NarL/FixJ family response regulator
MIGATNDIGRQLYANPRRRADFFQLIQTRDAVTDFESEIHRADGSTLWISESVRVVRRADGTIDHFEGVAVDITQRHEAGRILRAAKDAADTASRAKSRFLASVSHELRTPLNGILGYTQILRRDAALGEKQREGVRVIHESADHLLALINDLLDLSKIEAGRLDLQAVDFDLPGFAIGAARVFAPRAREKNLHLETELAPDLPRFVHGDEQRLRQIVFNLLANAVKFTARGGVVFSVQRVPDTEAAGPAGAELFPLRFSVSDTGPGISRVNLERIFEPFTQVGDLAQNVTGTGLGLAISRSLVERFGGKLHVESRLGWGSRFWFDLAFTAASTDGAALAADGSRRIVGYAGARRRILVVDDNPANRAIMVGLLAPLGFECAEANDGVGALEQAAAWTPDLVLMDLRLPGRIDGLEATRQLRATPRTTAIRIVAVSASAFYLDRDDCFTAGCDAFLAKPFREEELWGVIERALDLEWQYGELEGSNSPFPRIVHAPPAAEAAALFDLATKGDVVAIRARAQALLATDPQLGPFAQNVLDLAARFKMKAIRQFVARYLPGAGSSA